MICNLFLIWQSYQGYYCTALWTGHPHLCMDAYIPINHTFLKLWKNTNKSRNIWEIVYLSMSGTVSIRSASKLRLLFQSPRFKKIGKIRPYLRQLSFRIQAVSYFTQSWVKKNGLIFYLEDFHGRNCRRIPGFDENKTQHYALFSTKINQGRFYFHWAQLLSRA